MRPPEKNGSGNGASTPTGTRSNGRANGDGQPSSANQGTSGVAGKGRSRANGKAVHTVNGHGNGDANGDDSGDLDARILQMEKAVGTAFYRNILREYGRVNQPKLIRDIVVKQKVLRILESATRGFSRLDAVTKWLDQNTVDALLAKLQAPPLDAIKDMKTLEHVVFGLEELAGPNQHHAA
jgi:hypothetical protein